MKAGEMRLRAIRAEVGVALCAAVVALALCAAGGASQALAARSPDIGCNLDLRQHPHFSSTGRKRGRSEVTWKVTVTCYFGKIVSGKFVFGGARAPVALMHVRMALYRNGKQVGQSSVDRPEVSYLTVPAAGPCTAGAIYQGWGKAVAVLPPGYRDYRNGTQFSINQGWGYHVRVRSCS